MLIYVQQSTFLSAEIVQQFVLEIWFLDYVIFIFHKIFIVVIIFTLSSSNVIEASNQISLKWYPVI